MQNAEEIELVSQSTEIALSEEIKSIISFDRAIVDEFLKKIRDRELSVIGDISTEKGRKELASRARKIANQKNDIKRAADLLKEDHQKVIKEINTESKRIWDEMESIQHEVRKPLTDWENIEKERVAAHEKTLAKIASLCAIPPDSALEVYEQNLRHLDDAELLEFEEFRFRAEAAIKQSRDYLVAAHARRTKEIADAAELAELRRKQAEQEQKDREDRIASEAAAKAKADAESKALADAKVAQDKADAEKAEIEARAKKAEADKLAAEQKAKADAEAAAKAERDKIQREKEAEEKAAADRESNKVHKAKINNEILSALTALDAVLTDDAAKSIITAIAQGKIPHVKISY